MNYSIGIDLGGTNTAMGLVNSDGKIEKHAEVKTQSTDGTPNAYLHKLVDALKTLMDHEQVRGIGIGAPAANYFTGTIEQAANIPWLSWTPIAQILSSELGCPVVLNNDAKSATIGEMTFGAARGMKNFIMVTLGTGIGSGVVIDGNLIYGRNGMSGELGHTTIRRDGRSCSCGRRGCLETYCSATGVARSAKELIDLTTTPSLLRDLPTEEITSYDVYRAAINGDKMAKEIFNFTGQILGEAFADFAHFSSPEAFILFGGLAQAGDLLVKPAREAMERNLLPGFKNTISILVSTLPAGDAAILGASALV